MNYRVQNYMDLGIDPLPEGMTEEYLYKSLITRLVQDMTLEQLKSIFKVSKVENDNELHSMYSKVRFKAEAYPNDIIHQNRLISDTTFATRLKGALNRIKDHSRYAMEAEELEYLLKISNKLIELQCETVSDLNEIRYLNHNNKN